MQSTLDDDDVERALYNREESRKHMNVKEMLKMMDLPEIVKAYFYIYEKLQANYPVLEEQVM